MPEQNGTPFQISELEWRDHRRELNLMSDVTNTLAVIPEHTKTLPSILDQLKHMNENLLAPATGRKQVPLSVYFMTTGILLVVVVIQVITGTDRNVTVTPTSLSITKAQAESP